MALYIGSKKGRLRLGDISKHINFYSTIVPMIDGIILLSSDNYTLKDKNGLYLTAKDGE